MGTRRQTHDSVDDYIAAFAPEVQAILRRIRSTVREAAPDAVEGISYAIPSFKLEGALVYFAAFKQHIGFYPPIKGDPRLERAVSKYAGEKGNLRFPLDEPIPYALIGRIVKLRVKQNRAKKSGKAATDRRPSRS